MIELHSAKLKLASADSGLPSGDHATTGTTNKEPAWQRLPVEFAESAFDGAIQTPFNGLAEIVNHVAGRKVLPELHLVDVKAAKFGSLDWHVEQVGGAVGMGLSLFFLDRGLNAGVNRGAELLGSGGWAEESATASMTGQFSAGTFARKVALGAASGGIYGFLQPQPAVEPYGFLHPGSGGFWNARFKQAAATSITFGALSATGLGISALGSVARFENGALGALLRNGVASGVLSGAAAGVAGAESNSLIAGKGPASLKDVLETSYGYAFVGGLSGGLDKLDAGRTLARRPEAPPAQEEEPGITLLLDGGGVKGWGHIGLLKYLEDNGVKIQDEYGVSIGALLAALHTNGYSADQIQQIFWDEFHNPEVLKYLPQRGRIRELARFTDLEPLMRHFVNKYDLKPQENLHIITYGLRGRQSLRFEGTNYDLPKALAASAAVPGPFKWVRYTPEGALDLPGRTRKMTLLDGGIHETSVKDLPPGNIVMSKLVNNDAPGLLSTMLGQRIGGRAERLVGSIAERLLKRNVGSANDSALVVNVGKPDVVSMGFKQPDRTLLSMVRHGVDQAKSTLEPAILEGRLPLVETTNAP